MPAKSIRAQMPPIKSAVSVIGIDLGKNSFHTQVLLRFRGASNVRTLMRLKSGYGFGARYTNPSCGVRMNLTIATRKGQTNGNSLNYC